MLMKHILYINNNRQLKWGLCQGVLVTQSAKEHTPCVCGLTPAIESFMRGTGVTEDQQQPAEAFTYVSCG